MTQKSAKINEIQRASAFEQADVAVLQSAANRDLATAQTILDNRTKLALEPLKTKLQFQQFFYEENKENLTKAEDRAFQNAIKESDRAYQEAQTFEKTKSDQAFQALKDGNTKLYSAINASTTPTGLSSAVEKYTVPNGGLTFKTLSDGRDVMIDKDGNIIKEISGVKLTKDQQDALAASENAKRSIPSLNDKLGEIDRLTRGLDLGVYSGAVGPSSLARGGNLSFITGANQNFVAGVEQLVSTETLKALTDLKAAGGALGALSDGERQTLQAAATKIGSWAIKEDGNVVGYNTTEKAFKDELSKIRTLTERAISKANGSDLDNRSFLDTLPTPQASNSIFFGALSTPNNQ